ncbi:hypothetical protein N657DRAFT_268143 [Parathielavia appendiculata]|uniref:Uncharacterized protein n=1 Tax=Parathielavia appendiculata TaxID=2587402 RepID=A0AAN6U3H2_9PEZI|nr:hypothetical protein N657DRAFT_268143 [Parathielavia appendiculata]
MRRFTSPDRLPFSFIAQAWDSLAWKTDLLSQFPFRRPEPIRLFDQIRSLQLTIWAVEWGLCHSSWPLASDPFVMLTPVQDKKQMEGAMALTTTTTASQQQPPPRRPENWSLATALALLPSLRTLTVGFETCHGRTAEVERIVRWTVATWRFMVFGNLPKMRLPEAWMLEFSHLLRSAFASACDGERHRDGGTHAYDMPPDAETLNGRPVTRRCLVPPRGGMERVRRWSWRGLPYHWQRRCPACLEHDTQEYRYCEERRALEEKSWGRGRTSGASPGPRRRTSSIIGARQKRTERMQSRTRSRFLNRNSATSPRRRSWCLCECAPNS